MIAGLSMRRVKTNSAPPQRHNSRYALAVLFALAAVGIAFPATAQAPAPAAAITPTPAAILIARQIVALKDEKDVLQPIVVGVVERTKNLVMQTNFMWQKDIDQVALDLHKQYDPRVSELMDASARFYATHFTEQELKDLLTFYQSPLGQKELTEEPIVLDESMTYAGRWADNLAEEVMASMRAEMKKRGHDM